MVNFNMLSVQNTIKQLGTRMSHDEKIEWDKTENLKIILSIKFIFLLNKWFIGLILSVNEKPQKSTMLISFTSQGFF